MVHAKSSSSSVQRPTVIVILPGYGRVRLARFARIRLLRHALPISLLILRKKPTVLQSTVCGEFKFYVAVLGEKIVVSR